MDYLLQLGQVNRDTVWQVVDPQGRLVRLFHVSYMFFANVVLLEPASCATLSSGTNPPSTTILYVIAPLILLARC